MSAELDGMFPLLGKCTLSRDELLRQSTQPHYVEALIAGGGMFVRYLDNDDDDAVDKWRGKFQTFGASPSAAAAAAAAAASSSMHQPLAVQHTDDKNKDDDDDDDEDGTVSRFITKGPSMMDGAAGAGVSGGGKPQKRMYKLARVHNVIFSNTLYDCAGQPCDVELELYPAPKGKSHSYFKKSSTSSKHSKRGAAAADAPAVVELQRVSNQPPRVEEFEAWLCEHFANREQLLMRDVLQQKRAAAALVEAEMAASKRKQKKEAEKRKKEEEEEKKKSATQAETTNVGEDGEQQQQQQEQLPVDGETEAADANADDTQHVTLAAENTHTNDDHQEDEHDAVDDDATGAAAAAEALEVRLHAEAAIEVQRRIADEKRAFRESFKQRTDSLEKRWKSRVVDYILADNKDQRDLMLRTEKLRTAKANLAGEIKARQHQIQLEIEKISETIGVLLKERQHRVELKRQKERVMGDDGMDGQPQQAAAVITDSQIPQERYVEDNLGESSSEEDDDDFLGAAAAAAAGGGGAAADGNEMLIDDGEGVDEGLMAFRSLTQRSGTQCMFGDLNDDGNDADGNSASGGGGATTKIFNGKKMITELEAAQRQARKLFRAFTRANREFTECIRGSTIRGGNPNAGSGAFAALTTRNRESNMMLMLRGEKLRAMRDAKTGKKTADDNIWTLDANQRFELSEEFVATGGERNKVEDDKKKVVKPPEVIAAERQERILERARNQLTPTTTTAQRTSSQGGGMIGSPSSSFSGSGGGGGSGSQQQGEEGGLLFGDDDLFADLVRSATTQQRQQSAGAGMQMQRSQSAGSRSNSTLFSYPRRRGRDDDGGGAMLQQQQQQQNSMSSGEMQAPFNSAASF